MDKQIIDALLGAMIQSREGVSDLLFTVGKPPFVEAYGFLEEFPVETPGSVFGPKEIGQLADHIINGDERLVRDLATWGLCDCSYSLKVVMRKLQSEVPTLDALGLPPIIREINRYSKPSKPILLAKKRRLSSVRTNTKCPKTSTF
jgi:twitching motility protein PilT